MRQVCPYRGNYNMPRIFCQEVFHNFLRFLSCLQKIFIFGRFFTPKFGFFAILRKNRPILPKVEDASCSTAENAPRLPPREGAQKPCFCRIFSAFLCFSPTFLFIYYMRARVERAFWAYFCLRARILHEKRMKFSLFRAKKVTLYARVTVFFSTRATGCSASLAVRSPSSPASSSRLTYRASPPAKAAKREASV